MEVKRVCRDAAPERPAVHVTSSRCPEPIKRGMNRWGWGRIRASLGLVSARSANLCRPASLDIHYRYIIHQGRAVSSSIPTKRVMSAMSENPSEKSKILVFGAGNFGSCLADHLGDSQHDVFMWSREADLVEHFNRYHRNIRYLKDHEFSPNIKAIGPELPGREYLRQMDVLLFAIPTQGLRCVPVSIMRKPARDHIVCRETLTKLRPSLDEEKLPLLIFVNKGIEVGTNALTLDIIAETCGKEAARAATFIVRFKEKFPHLAH